MRILTYNVGLLDFLFGRVRPAPYVEERLRALPGALLELDADIIALQEIYSTRHRLWVQAALRATYPHAVQADARAPVVGLPDGLLVFSKFPVAARFAFFTSAPVDERLLARKGILCADVALPGAKLTLLNVHTTAGGIFQHPENIDGIRELQLKQLFGVAAGCKSDIVLIVGDINAGPGVSDRNYRSFEANGYVDLHRAANAGAEEPTWESSNPLNRAGPHRTSPPQRVDHVFARQDDVRFCRCTPLWSRIVLREPRVGIPGRGAVPVSDHYGVLTEVDLQVGPSAGRAPTL